MGTLWILNHYAISPDMSGGTRHFDLARELVKKGHEVTIFASGFDHHTRQYLKIKPGEKMRVEEYHGVRFVWVNTLPYTKNDWRRVLNMLSYGWRVLRCSRVLSKPDAVIGSSMHPFAALAGWWLARRYGAKFIFEVRDLWPQVLKDMGEMSEHNPIIKLLRRLELFLYRKSERIIILGSQMREYIIAHGINKEKIVWIPNGVDLSRFDSVAPERENKSDFRVMYLGAHSKTNALHVLLEGAKTIQDRGYISIRFSLIGDGPEKQGLFQLANKMQLENVEFCQPVPKDDVPNVLKRADVLVLTKDSTFAVYSGSILKMFDYMASCKPVVFSGEVSYNPIAESQCGFTVPPGDATALADAIIALYHMPQEERAAMGRRGREFVEKHHDIRLLAKLLESVIER